RSMRVRHGDLDETGLYAVEAPQGERRPMGHDRSFPRSQDCRLESLQPTVGTRADAIDAGVEPRPPSRTDPAGDHRIGAAGRQDHVPADDLVPSQTLIQFPHAPAWCGTGVTSTFCEDLRRYSPQKSSQTFVADEGEPVTGSP